MEETKTQPTETVGDKPAAAVPPGGQAGKPIVHRVCEACNNMFATHPGEKGLRCPNCRKE